MVRYCRFFAVIAVSLLAVLAAHSPATSAAGSQSSALYDEGDGWYIMRSAGKRACIGYLMSGGNALMLTSMLFEGKIYYSIGFLMLDGPAKTGVYRYEIRNEASLNMRFSASARKWDDGATYVVGAAWSIKQLKAVTDSRTLFVETNGGGAGRYDLSSKRMGIGRFYDCVKSNEKKKSPPATPPTVRRMN